MNNTSEYFAAGFVKAAMAKGFSEDEAIEIYKQATTLDDGYLANANRFGGIGSIIGAGVGGIAGIEGGPVGAGMGALIGSGSGYLTGAQAGLAFKGIHDLFHHKKPVPPIDPSLVIKQADDEDKSSFWGRYFNLKGQRIQSLIDHPIAGGLSRGVMGGLPIPGKGMFGLSNAIPFATTAGVTPKRREDEIHRQQEELGQTGYVANALRGMQSGAIAGSIAGPTSGLMLNALRRTRPSLPGLALRAGIGALIGGGAGGDFGLASKFINKHTTPASKEEATERLSKHPLLHGIPGADIISSLRPWKSGPTQGLPPVQA